MLRWTVEALKKVIAMLRNPEFDSKEVNPDLHKSRKYGHDWLAAWKLWWLTLPSSSSMITLSTEYAAHFHDVYINGKEKAKMTGDRMKMLMLTLPFVVPDLIAPDVISMY